MRVGIVAVAAGAILGAAPASAADVKKKGSADDSSRKICETVEEIGSRLARKRICMTKAEWQAVRQETRMSLDKATAIRPTSE